MEGRHEDERPDALGPGRRAVLKGLGAGLGVAASWPFLSPAAAEALESLRATGVAASPVFLTTGEFAAVDALSERLIPADAQSPGAKAARVADFIDLLLSEQESDVQATWRQGLAELEELARSRQGRGFAALEPAQQDALLVELSGKEAAPLTLLERFFVEAKLRTVQGYYTSEIGIHKELRYKGNQFLQEFVGYEEQT